MSNINKKSQRLTPESRSNESRLGIDVPDRENDDVSLAIIDKGFGRRTYAQGARRQGLEPDRPSEPGDDVLRGGGLHSLPRRTRNDVIHRAQLMQSNAETISKLERKYREYTGELRRRYF